MVLKNIKKFLENTTKREDTQKNSSERENFKLEEKILNLDEQVKILKLNLRNSLDKSSKSILHLQDLIFKSLDNLFNFDRITEINEDNGTFGKGSLKAELDIKEDLWFFDCHFKGDPVMPGCLGLDAMWQLVGFYLGWLGNPGKGRALGVSTVKFTGEVLQNVKNVRYEIDMKKIMAPGGTTVGLANGLVFADDKKIYSAESLKVGLFK